MSKSRVQDYKKWLAGGQQGSFQPTKKNKTDESDREELLANFNLKWIEDFNKVQQRITKVRQESSPELIQMLQEVLTALQAEEIKTPLLTGTKFASYSLGYQIPGKPERIGVVWTEDQNMGTFFHIMEACRKAIEQKLCKTLYLIRAEGMGKANNKGYKLYTKIFTGSPHRRITPNPLSVQYLVTYYDLVKDAREGDFVIRGETIGFKNLQALTRESEVLHDCPLLQELEVVPVGIIKPPPIEPVKDFLFNFVITQHFLGRQTLIQNASSQFPDVDESQIDELIDQLCQENKIQILDPRAKPKAQLVCLVPKAS